MKDGHANLRGEDVEVWDPMADDGPPPPVPDTPSRIPYATPPIAEEEEEDQQGDRKSGQLLTLLECSSWGVGLFG